ncbi:homeobox protein notochord [Rousettus aegyptiacus]|uniref:homeobox protein notochord n=1 Tax=Rousettus aegyptiacus TaxID=9407 RepID=UPI00168D32E1|nr:homeobox protein notochord [Rousettus aegyptiacus]
MPSPVDPRVQPSRSGSSPEPRSPSPQRHSARPGTPRTPRRLESSFSIQAILAKPDPPAPAASPLSASACAASGLWTAPSLSPAPVLPWACPAPWLPASLSVGLCQRCLQPSALGLRMAHLCSLQGLGVPGTSLLPLCLLLLPSQGQRQGLELAHYPGLWGPSDWVPAEELEDTERPQKRVRTMFNLEQLEELEKVFAKQHNLVGKNRAQLAARLKLTENQVRVWFQNRRVKYQKQQRLKPPATSAMAVSMDEPSSSSDTNIQREDTESGVDN